MPAGFRNPIGWDVDLWRPQNLQPGGRNNWGMSKESLALIAQARKTQSVNLDVYPYTASSTVLMADWVPSAEKVLVTWSVPHPELNGKDLADICAQWNVDSDEACARLDPAGAIYFQMDDGDLERILAFDLTPLGRGHPCEPWGTRDALSQILL